MLRQAAWGAALPRADTSTCLDVCIASSVLRLLQVGGTPAHAQQKANGSGRSRGGARRDDVDMEVTFAPGLETLGERLAAKRAPKQAETVWEQYMRRRRCPIYSQYLCQAAACNLDVAHANQGKCAGLQAYNACMQTAMAIPEQDARVKELFVIVNKEGNP